MRLCSSLKNEHMHAPVTEIDFSLSKGYYRLSVVKIGKRPWEVERQKYEDRREWGRIYVHVCKAVLAWFLVHLVIIDA